MSSCLLTAPAITMQRAKSFSVRYSTVRPGYSWGFALKGPRAAVSARGEFAAALLDVPLFKANATSAGEPIACSSLLVRLPCTHCAALCGCTAFCGWANATGLAWPSTNDVTIARASCNFGTWVVDPPRPHVECSVVLTLAMRYVLSCLVLCSAQPSVHDCDIHGGHHG